MRLRHALGVLLAVSCSPPGATTVSAGTVVLRAEVAEDAPAVLRIEQDGETIFFGPSESFSVSNAYPTVDPLGLPAVGVEIAEPDRERLSRWSTAHSGVRVGIFVDGELKSAPQLSSALRDSFTIQEDFTTPDVIEFARRLRGTP